MPNTQFTLSDLMWEMGHLSELMENAEILDNEGASITALLDTVHKRIDAVGPKLDRFCRKGIGFAAVSKLDSPWDHATRCGSHATALSVLVRTVTAEQKGEHSGLLAVGDAIAEHAKVIHVSLSERDVLPKAQKLAHQLVGVVTSLERAEVSIDQDGMHPMQALSETITSLSGELIAELDCKEGGSWGEYIQ